MRDSTRKHIGECKRCQRALLIAGKLYTEHAIHPGPSMKDYMAATGQVVEACAELVHSGERSIT